MFDVGFFESKARSLIKISFKISKTQLVVMGGGRKMFFFSKMKAQLILCPVSQMYAVKLFPALSESKNMCCSFCLTKAQTGRLQSINKIFHT